VALGPDYNMILLNGPPDARDDLSPDNGITTRARSTSQLEVRIDRGAGSVEDHDQAMKAAGGIAPTINIKTARQMDTPGMIARSASRA